MADPIKPRTTASPPPTATSSVEATYEQIRQALGAESPDSRRAPSDLRVADVTEVAAGVRMVALRTPTLPPATQTNCYVFGPSEGDGEGALVLVDPGSPYPEEQSVLDEWLAREEAAGRRPVAVVLTHHHADHIGGAAHLQARWNLEVLAHAATVPLVAPRVRVNRVVEPGEHRIGDVSLRVHHTPGHAIGHICLQQVSAGVTAVGDMVAGVGTILIDPDEGDMAEYLASLERLEGVAPGALLPAHGPVIADGLAKLREYRAHRLRREQKILEAVAAAPGARAEELVPMAYADTPAPFWPLAVRSTLAHLEKLRREGRVRSDGERWS